MIRNLRLITLKIVLFLGLISPAMLNGQGRIRQFLRAPDVLPGTLPEMRTPDYWIDLADNPDAVILSPSQIQQMNQAFLARMKDLPATES